VTIDDKHPDNKQVFALLCWARARLWQFGDIRLQKAADELQQFAERSGLIEAIGADAVQAIISRYFWEVRDDL
jgi:hypothetical protein